MTLSINGAATPARTDGVQAAAFRCPTVHRMGRRSNATEYSMPGMYHITVHVAAALGHPLGRVTGDAGQADGQPDAPRVELSTLGSMVEHELLNSIARHYPMVEVQTYVVMPEHLHFILEVHEPIVSRNGRRQHLGQVIAGFKMGCNRCYWALTGQSAPGAAGGGDEQRGKPAAANGGAAAGAAGLRPAVSPQGYKVPSRAATGRQGLFEAGYVDVMPLRKGQLAQQRLYIKNNPRSRLMRITNRAVLQADRSGIDTALTVSALKGYLTRVCHPSQVTADMLASLCQQLLTTADGRVDCHSYGDRRLLERPLLSVVCHRSDRAAFARQKEQCLQAARTGAVLVSARIAKGEQEIIDEAVGQGRPVILVLDNGMDERYHPSQERIERCLEGRLLLVTPWKYRYRGAEEAITVAECKAMNCVAQALCRRRDDWWKETTGGGNPPAQSATGEYEKEKQKAQE